MLISLILSTTTIISFATYYIFTKNIKKQHKFKKDNISNNIEQIRNEYERNPNRNRVLIIYDHYGNYNITTVEEILKNNKNKIDYSEILDDFSKVKIAENDLENCSISMEKIKKGDVIRILNCKHYFLKEYIDIWLKHNPTCPLCRKYITD